MSEENVKRATVMVSGCFDLLHAGHVAFLQQAAPYGRVHVAVGSDANIEQLKGRLPMFGQDERVYMLRSLQCVDRAFVSSGSGWLDFLPDLDRVKPNLFVVNEDGHDDKKESACLDRGIEYVVLSRTPTEGLPARCSCGIKTQIRIPFRVCIAGGWLDQPWVSSVHPGAVITARLAPTVEFADRSGMATSTRKAAQKIWNGRIPAGDPEQIARVILGPRIRPGHWRSPDRKTRWASFARESTGLPTTVATGPKQLSVSATR